MRKQRLLVSYILGEMAPTFISGVMTFIFILLMFQSLRLTEFVLVHGVSLFTLAQMLFYMSISFLPAIFPMSLIFSVLLTYLRLSSDSEIVAMRSLGFSLKSLSIPAILFAIVIGLLSAQASFQMAPWGNRKFEVLISELGSSKAMSTIKEGTFSEGFFDLVIYANKVNHKTGELDKVFIYDERNPDSPTTIVSRKGQILGERSRTEQMVFIRLIDGNIHKTRKLNHTKIYFKTYDLKVLNPINIHSRKKSMQSHTLKDLTDKIESKTTTDKKPFVIELHKRWSLAFACFLFALVGVGLGCQTNLRSGKSGGFTLSVGLIILYWVLFVASDGLAKGSPNFYTVLIWLPNIIFSFLAAWTFSRVK